MSDEGINFDIGFDVNDDDARREADRVAQIFEERMQRAFSNLGKEFSEAFREFRQESSRVSGRVAEDLRDVGRAAKRSETETEALSRDITALTQRFTAFRRAASAAGADTGLLSVYERQLQRLLGLQRDFERDRDLLNRKGNEQMLRARAQEVELVRRGLIAEGRAIQSELRDQNTIRQQALNRRREQENNASRERVEAQRAASSRFVVQAQLEGAQRLAAQRIAGQRQIAEERATARRRQEILRFALGQFRALERGLGSVFSGVGAVVSGATRRVAQALSSMGDTVRRGNREFTDGLSPALQRRETLISRSFREQEISVSRSVLRQQAIMERFEQRASVGVAGAATGRSLTGRGLAGLGLGVGAGLGAGSLLTSGFTRFSNLERLQKQFEALTGSIEQSQILLEQVADFAKTTPFDLVGVADLAKGFLAIGTAVEDVIPQVKIISDAVALTGGNADNLVRIQRAIGQVVSAGRLQGDELNQLAENLPGLNIRRILAEQLTGGDVAALVEMQEAGELSAEKFVQGLLTGLGSDPRLVGASEDLARTLGGRIANLRESFEDFGASLIGLIASPLRQAVLIAQTALQGLADFIRGDDLSGALETLRIAAGGAAIALGSLIVARAAGQAIQFLGLAVRAVLTPFGIFAFAVAGAGAALAVLMQRSPEVREAVTRLAEAVGEALAPAMELAADLLEAFTDFLVRTALPALEEFATSLIQRIQPALETVGTFIVETVMPGLVSFADVLVNRVIPTIARGLTTAFDAARSAATAFWDFVQPIIQPAIDGFGSLASAIRNLDAGAVLPALGDVGAGIGRTFANIGTLIFNGLREPVLNAVEFLRSQFTIDKLRPIATGLLDLVELLGFTVANIVTDRRVVTALAAIVAAAGVVAFRLVRGLARGILDNLPDLADALRDLGAFILRALVDAILNNIPTFLALLGAALLAGRAIAAWKNIGTQWGKAAGEGFFKQVTGTVNSLAAQRRSTLDFLGGVFAGSNLAAATERARRDIVRQVQQTNRDLIALQGAPGAAARDSRGRFTGLDNNQLQQNNTRLQEIERTMGRARMQGTLFGDAMRRTFDGLAQRNIPAVRQALGDLGRQLGAAARAVGVTLGNALTAGVGAALSGVALGSGTGVGQAVGLAGVISSALFGASAAAPLGPGVAAAVGATTLAIGGLTAVLTANSRASEKAAAEMREYRDALVDANSASERLQSVTDVVFANLEDEAPAVIRLLERMGFNARLFADQVIDGTFNAETAFRSLVTSFGASGREALAEFDRRGGGSIEDFLDRLAARQVPGLAGTSPFTTLREDIEAAGFAVGDLTGLMDFFGDESGELESQLLNASAIRGLADNANSAAVNLDLAGSSARIFASAVAQQFIGAVEGMSTGIGGVVTKLGELRQARTTELEAQIDRISSRLSGAQVAADAATDRLLNFFTAGTGTAIDQAVIGVEAIATAVQEASAGVGGEIIDSARRAIAVGDLRGEIQNIVSEGFRNLTIDDVDTGGDILRAISPLVGALDELLAEGVISPETRAALGAEITGALSDPNLVPTIQAALDGQAMVEDLQRQLDDAEVTLNAQLNLTNLDDIRNILNGEAAPAEPRITREDFAGTSVPQSIVNIEVNGAREPTRVARATVRELALQGARAAARADRG